MLTHFAVILFDGVAFGCLLFIISVGLSVTMGLMNFVNLAHGAFAMLGGFLCVSLMTRGGMSFLLTLPVIFVAGSVGGALLERLIFRRLYGASHLDQVLLTIGLTYVAVACATYIWGPSQQVIRLPSYFAGHVRVLGLDLGIYRLFLIAVVLVITLVLALLVSKTRFGAMIRASVDNALASSGLGINVSRVFTATFALGSGLAAIGGGLGIDVVGLDSTFALKYMVYFLVVVAVGGSGSMTGTLLASLTLGICDIAGKYYVPELGAFIIYLVMIVVLLLFPSGLLGRQVPQSAASSSEFRAGRNAAAATRRSLPGTHWRRSEVAFWLTAMAVPFLAPDHLLLATQIAITALFALSLDLILGYAGIVSLGHAAFFGSGAYAAGLLAHYGWGEPITGLIVGGVFAAAMAWTASFLVIRGGSLSRLMVTLGISLMLVEAANQAVSITGGADGISDIPMWNLLGIFPFDLAGKTAYAYSVSVLFVFFWLARRIVNSPLGLSLRGMREGERRMPAIGAPVRRRIITIYTIAGGFAGIAGALLVQTTQFVGLDVLGFDRSTDILIMLVLGGLGRLYGGLIGAAVFILTQDFLSDLNPMYWQFWLGLLLITLALSSRRGIIGECEILFGRVKALAR